MKDPKTKQCRSCKKVKQLIRFHKDIRNKDGRQATCKVCRSKKYNRGDAKRNRNLKYRYGISLEEFDKMLERQGNACAICEKQYVKGNNRFHVDHCHENGHIRGILCHSCNTGLGKLGDSEKSIEKVLRYLKGEDERQD